MSVIKDMTIKHKLILVIMITCIVALILAGTVFVAWEWVNYRQSMVRSLLTQAEMIGNNCKASLTFDSPGDAGETLNALRANSSIVFGGIYDKENQLFAAYYRNGTNEKVQPAELRKYSHVFCDKYLTVVKAISLDGEIIGTVCIRSDLRLLCALLIRNIRVISVVLVFASLVAYVVSSKLQNIISVPILRLAESAKKIGEGDFDQRVDVQYEDELGHLAQSFNKMIDDLKALMQRDRELAAQAATAEVERERAAELEKAYQELERVNKELSDFAYIVSHDLKAPLRGINTLVNWILADSDNKFSAESKEQMQLLLNRVDRMHNLIDGILQYSKVGRVKEEKAQVNLNELVPEIIDLIAPPQNITIAIENELPVIECEKTRIFQVFQNLLSNAVKYMDKPQGQIRVGCIEEEDCWKFSVTDNGPGIEEKYFDKIFQMFQTLSRRDDVESTGVGLTVVKKIVDMYGGRIWVESKVGEGSVFLFTLPKQMERVKDEKLEESIV
nr:adaptive-response sensory-kinase SasA [uncultured archaeon]